jgi:hypothetical protein
MSARSGAGQVLRRIGTALLLVLAVYLVGRAVVEVAAVDPGNPADYRDDWGGPSYLGVLAVHTGPGLLAIAAAVFWWRRRAARRRDAP